MRVSGATATTRSRDCLPFSDRGQRAGRHGDDSGHEHEGKMEVTHWNLAIGAIADGEFIDRAVPTSLLTVVTSPLNWPRSRGNPATPSQQQWEMSNSVTQDAVGSPIWALSVSHCPATRAVGLFRGDHSVIGFQIETACFARSGNPGAIYVNGETAYHHVKCAQESPPETAMMCWNIPSRPFGCCCDQGKIHGVTCQIRTIETAPDVLKWQFFRSSSGSFH